MHESPSHVQGDRQIVLASGGDRGWGGPAGTAICYPRGNRAGALVSRRDGQALARSSGRVRGRPRGQGPKVELGGLCAESRQIKRRHKGVGHACRCLFYRCCVPRTGSSASACVGVCGARRGMATSAGQLLDEDDAGVDDRGRVWGLVDKDTERCKEDNNVTGRGGPNQQ
jgi:hypothetical protein